MTSRHRIAVANGFLFLSVLLMVNVADASTGVTYHGRLMKSDDTPVSSASVTFRVQIRTPGNENCLLYEEQQVKNLSTSKGVFALTIGDGTATVVNTEPFTLDRAFQNRGTFTFSGSKCVSGSTYSPNPTDGRRIAVEFNDGTFAGWEQIPTQQINFVPMAIEALTLGGFGASNVVRVVDGTGAPAVVAPLTQSQHNALTGLLDGTGAVAGQAAGFTGALGGDVTGTQASTTVTKIQGRAVDTAAPSNGQALVWSAANSRWEPGTVSGGGGGDWSTLTGKPTTFPSDWSTLANIPSTFSPSAHSHPINEISSGTGAYFNYSPNGSACAVGDVLKWDSTGGGRWVCGNDAGAAGAAPTGAAGGELAGNYPNPTVVASTTATNDSLVRRDGTGGISATAGDFSSLVLTNGTSSITLSTPVAFTTYATKLPPTTGTNGQILTSNGADMVWANASSITAANVSGTVAVANGGTGATTASAARTNLGLTATGNALATAADAAAARAAISAMLNVAPGANGNVLTSNGTAWTSAPFTVNAANVGSSVGGYFTYKPNNGACANGEVLKWETAGGGRWVCGTDISSTGGTGVASVSATAPVTVDNTDPNNPRVEIDDATTTSTGVVQLATSADTTAGLVVQADDTRLTNSRAPTGAAGGDLTGTYPNPTIAKLQTKDITMGTLNSGDILQYDGSKWVNSASVTATNVSGTVAIANGGTGATTAANARTNLGATATGSSLFTAADAAAARTAISAMQNVTPGTSGNVLTSNGTSWTSAAPSVSASNFASQTQNTVLAAPTASNGTPSFRALVAGDIPDLSAAKITSGTLAVAQGGTGVTSLPGTFVMKGGQAGAVTLGSTDANAVTLSTTNTARLTVAAAGNVGVGTTNPTSKLDVNGQIRTTAGSIANGAVDWNAGNSVTTSYDCAANITLANLRDGGNYSLAVTGTGTAQCNFDTAVTGADAGTVTYRFKPANGPREASSHTIYSFMRIGTVVYVSWISGF